MSEFNDSPATAKDLGDARMQTQSRKKVIAISGMPGAGKGVASEAAKLLGLDVLVLGDVIREETQRRGLEPTPKNIGAVMLQVREDEGLAAVAKRLLPKIEACRSGVVIVEGIRGLQELTELESKYDVLTLAVHASPKIRYQRLVSRGRSDDPKSWETFHERDNRELNVGLGHVIALADILVVNEGSIDELQARVKEILARLSAQ